MSNAADNRVVPDRSEYFGDWVITLCLLVIMGGAFYLAQGWPRNTAFFPDLLSIAGVALAVYKIAILVIEAPVVLGSHRRAAEAAALAASGPAVDGEGEFFLAGGDEEDGSDVELHSIFAKAGGKVWAGAVGWLALFFIGMYLFGMLIILPVFTVAYLRIVSKVSWLNCILYVLGTAGVIYLLFVWFLHLPIPEGLLITVGN